MDLSIDDVMANGASVTAPSNRLLAPEDLAQTLGCIRTILSIYATAAPDAGQQGADGHDDDDADVDVDQASEEAIQDVARFLQLPLASLGDEKSTALRDRIPSHVSLTLRLRPWRGMNESAGGASASWKNDRTTLHVKATFALRRGEHGTSQAGHEGIRWPQWSIQKETWLLDEHHAALVKLADEAAQEYRSRVEKEGADGQEEGESMSSYILTVCEEVSEGVLDLGDESH